LPLDEPRDGAITDVVEKLRTDDDEEDEKRADHDKQKLLFGKIKPSAFHFPNRFR